MRKGLEKYLIAPAFFLILASLSSGQSPTTVTEIDPGVAVGVELNHRVRLDFYAGREKSEELDSGKLKIGAGVSLRSKAIFKNFIDHFDSDKQHALVTAATYEYSEASEGGAKAIEHKLMLDATGRYAFAGKFLLSNRNRFEFRWIDGEQRFRYRNRLFLEHTWKVKKFKFTPFGGAEAFWDQKLNEWNQFRFTGGVQIPVPKFKRTSIDFYYERVRLRDVRESEHKRLRRHLQRLFQAKEVTREADETCQKRQL